MKFQCKNCKKIFTEQDELNSPTCPSCGGQITALCPKCDGTGYDTYLGQPCTCTKEGEKALEEMYFSHPRARVASWAN